MKNKLPLLTSVALLAGAASSQADMTITDLDTTAPSSGVFLSYDISTTNTKIENDTTDPDTGNYKARGQTFATPDTGDAATQWGLTGITLKSHSTVPTPPSNLVIEIWSWGANANSLGDQGSLLGSYTGAFTTVAAGVAANDYVNLDLGATVALDENSNYAFLLRSAEGGPAGNEWLLRIARSQSSPDDYADGLFLSDEGTNGLNSAAYKVYPGDDLVFYLHGTAIPSGGGDDYSTWATTNGIAGQPFDEDFNSDGITNGVAYALGLSPTVSSQPAGVLSANTITYTKGADAIANADVTWIIETSETLEAGLWVPEVTQVAGDATEAISYTFTPGPGTPKKFARLSVMQVP